MIGQEDVPLEDLPQLKLVGIARGELRSAFAFPFIQLRYTRTSPRTLMLLGQFQQSTSSLEETKRFVDNARIRFEQDPTIRAEFDAWSEKFVAIYARFIRAQQADLADLPAARQALVQFRNNSTNRDIERAFIYGHAARPLAAEVLFLMAMCVHERAERSQADGSARAESIWRNAGEWWGRYLDSSAQAGNTIPARDAHARQLQARCQTFIKK